MVEWYWHGKTEVLGEKHYTAWVVDKWIWNNGGMILTGKNWSTGRKTLYSVGGRWMNMEQWGNDTDREKLKYWEKNIIQRGWQMNEYGTMGEWYWQGKTEVLGEKHYTAWVADEWIWSNGRIILTGENWSMGRKALYSVGGRWMNMEQWGNDTDRGGKLKYWEKNFILRGW